MNLLDELWTPSPAAYGELRLLRDGEVRQQFYPIPNDELVRNAQLWDSKGWDCYFGVLPRTETKGTAEACVPTTHVLWADVDAKNTGGKWAGLVGIRQFRLTPTVIVDSGHGFHCYWFLKEPVPFGQAQNAMRWIAREVRGDSVYDAPRVLRIPGTHNHKGGEKLPVRVLYWDIGRRYRIGDFELELPNIRPGRYVELPRDRTDESPTWLVDLIEQGAPRGQRSEASFRAMLWMLRYGWSDEEILTAFEGSPDGLGQKMAEKKKDGQRWFDLTLLAAKKANQ